jgi:hypothetical protein
MTKGALIIVLFLPFTGIYAQVEPKTVDVSSTAYPDEWSNSYTGTLHDALPLSLELRKKGSEVTAEVVYGKSGRKIALEGSFMPDGDVTLYEFDQNARVAGIISGNLDSLTDWKWYSYDYARWWPIILRQGNLPEPEVHFLELDAPGSDVLSIRSFSKQLGFLSKQPYELRWLDFDCQGIDCILLPLNEDIDNPLEFKLEGDKSLKLLIYPSEQYDEARALPSSNLSGDKFSYFYAYHFPVVDQEAFDTRMIMEINQHLRQIRPTGEDNNRQPESRFKNGYFGDFFITMYSRDLVSGFLYFYSNKSSDIETLPFIYDLKKEEFCELADLFRSGYDYPFFIRTYLENQKRKQGIGQNRLTREYLNNLSYSHYVLTDKGLLFLSDFNMLFGRRSILIPFTEFSSFLDNKSVMNFAKRVR